MSDRRVRTHAWPPTRSPDDPLREVVRDGVAVLVCSARSVTFASITLVVDKQPVVHASSDQACTALEQVQYLAGEGPCVEALGSGVICLVSSIDDGPWPAFTRACRASGVVTAVALSLIHI